MATPLMLGRIVKLKDPITKCFTDEAIFLVVGSSSDGLDLTISFLVNPIETHRIEARDLLQVLSDDVYLQEFTSTDVVYQYLNALNTRNLNM